MITGFSSKVAGLQRWKQNKAKWSMPKERNQRRQTGYTCGVFCWNPGLQKHLFKCWEMSLSQKWRNREWDGWMASPTQWTWVWANSGRQWRTGKPGVLQSMGSQRVGHNLVTEQQLQKRAGKLGLQQVNHYRPELSTDCNFSSYSVVTYLSRKFIPL